MSKLPTPCAFLSSLLPPLSHTSAIPPSSNSPTGLQPSQKPLILTLHCLFPNELLPALDLLDRRLVTRLTIRSDTVGSDRDEYIRYTSQMPTAAPPQGKESGSHFAAESPSTQGLSTDHGSVYYVRSSHEMRSRFKSMRNEASASEGLNYEVRLLAWNCTCAAFAFAAFNWEWDRAGTFSNGTGDPRRGGLGQGKNGRREWQFGGVRAGEEVHICKHLLACVLAERFEALATSVDERVVGRAEVAGWVAGWGG